MSDALSRDEVRNIMVLGKTGVGKSATLNTILGQKFFQTGHGDSVTSHCDSRETSFHGMQVRLIDTPGGKDTKMIDNSKMIHDYILEHTDGIHLFVLVLSVSNPPTPEDIDVINQVQKQLGQGLEERLMIAVTRTDELEDGETLQGFLQSFASKHPIVDTCLERNRVLGFENGKHATDADKEKQRQQFYDKAQTITNDNRKSHYTHAQLKKQTDTNEKEDARLKDEKERKEREKKDLKEKLEKKERELSSLREATTGPSNLEMVVGGTLVATMGTTAALLVAAMCMGADRGGSKR